MNCPYCGKNAELVGGEVIYPRRPDLYRKKFWLCNPCGAYVGCHGKGSKPLGRLANTELRRWKQNAHAVFDKLWRSRRMSRSNAYKWLAKAMGIPPSECHIGMFTVDQCKEVVRLSRKKVAA